MRILFIPHTFPGPFRHVAARLAAMPGNKVLFLTDRARRDVRIPSVRRLLVPAPRTPETHDRAEHEAMLALRRGANMANALLKLKNDGFTPDMIVATACMGSSFYVQDIFPNAFYTVHADWFHTHGANYTFFSRNKNRSPVDFAPARVRNLFQWNALGECQLAVTSTNWQKSQYPEELQHKIHVLHEGVDTHFYSPKHGERFVIDGCDLSHVEELVTFSAGGLEPSRGFPQFYRSLPRLFEARPQCHALIMASERGSGESGTQTRSHILESLQAEVPVDPHRVHFVGFRPYEDYRLLLRASTVHVFLSAPFALSAGLFEAMSCGCLLVGSDTEPVREVVEHGKNGFLCDFWDTNALSDTVAGLLERAPQMEPIRKGARKTIVDKYSLSKRAPECVKFLLHHCEAWKAEGSSNE